MAAVTRKQAHLGRPESAAGHRGPELDQNRVQINKDRILGCLTKLNEKSTYKAAVQDLSVIVAVSPHPGAPCGASGAPVR